jgi:hypothetical protein
MFDNGGQQTLAMYPKQPFDIANGRTGTVVFDVSADSDGPHAAWPEFWWTDQPVPAAHGHMSGQAPYARNSFGFRVAQPGGAGTACPEGQVSIDEMEVTRNYMLTELPFDLTGCVVKGSPSGGLNHFEVRINQNRVEVWASDPGSTVVHQIAVANNANITMTRGVIWIEDVHYNACKDGGTQCHHTTAWDNVGFDGPTPYRDLSYDVPDANIPVEGGLSELGYAVGAGGRSFAVNGVAPQQTPASAIVTFNWFAFDKTVPSVSVNGGAPVATVWPFDDETFVWRTIAVSVPVAQVQNGTNTITLASGTNVTVSNINLILIAAAPVPTT